MPKAVKLELTLACTPTLDPSGGPYNPLDIWNNGGSNPSTDCCGTVARICGEYGISPEKCGALAQENGLNCEF
ncbi:MAG: hypothetical protein AB7P04_10425 [Bacteriovoracia bacterium]